MYLHGLSDYAPFDEFIGNVAGGDTNMGSGGGGGFSDFLSGAANTVSGAVGSSGGLTDLFKQGLATYGSVTNTKTVEASKVAQAQAAATYAQRFPTTYNPSVYPPFPGAVSGSVPQGAGMSATTLIGLGGLALAALAYISGK